MPTTNPGLTGDAQEATALNGLPPGGCLGAAPATKTNAQAPLTAAQLQAAAEEKARELEEIKRKLDEARQTEKAAFADHIRHQILESGFDYDAIVSALAKPHRKAPKGSASRARGSKLRTDPSCTYCGRGQLPRCVMEAMRREGLNPALGPDRARFLREFMEPIR